MGMLNMLKKGTIEEKSPKKNPAVVSTEEMYLDHMRKIEKLSGKGVVLTLLG